MKNIKIKIAISGAIGKMGKILIKNINKYKNLYLSVLLVKKKNSKIEKKINFYLRKKIKNKIILSDSINKVYKHFDILIDFSTPKNTIKNIHTCIKKKKKIVIGTTGFTKEEEKFINSIKNKISILKSANFSIGINIISNILKKITKKIGTLSDINIIEKHHRNKIDSPSGTAIYINKIIQKTINKQLKIQKQNFKEKNNNNNKISCSSIRAGEIIGEHKIIFTMPGETVEISHKAMNRKIFAIGSFIGAIWLYKTKNGLYNMKEVLKNYNINL